MGDIAGTVPPPPRRAKVLRGAGRAGQRSLCPQHVWVVDVTHVDVVDSLRFLYKLRHPDATAAAADERHVDARIRAVDAFGRNRRQCGRTCAGRALQELSSSHL